MRAHGRRFRLFGNCGRTDRFSPRLKTCALTLAPPLLPIVPPAGTALRDYIHVVDLARGHLAAVDWLFKRAGARGEGTEGAGLCEVFNLGTGRPSSVKEVIAAFEKASGRPVPHTFGTRREGDVQGSWADASKAASVLGWTAERSLADMCTDAWRWVTNNPNGYQA